MKDYKKLAEDVTHGVGGKDNIQSVTNCMTRLRFKLNDTNKVNEDQLKATPGVQGIAKKGGQFQVIIGTDVAEVAEEINKMGNFAVPSSLDQSPKNQKWYNRVLGAITDIFQPIIPAICGAGMLKAVLALVVFLKWLTTDSQTYQLLSLLADSAFYFLPIMLAITSAKRFHANPFFSAVLGGMLIHPNFVAMVAAGNPIKFLDIPVKAVSYGAAVVPPILIVLVMSYVEKYAKKIAPDAVKVFLVPLIVFLVTAPLAWIIIGPLGAIVGDVLLVIFEFFNNQARWVLPVLMGAFTPFFVMTGMHYSFMPVQLAQYATLGYGTLLGPGMLASNISQAGASFAVGLKTKDKVMKTTAFSAATTALFGITEPALYGVTMKLKKPLWVVVLSGGIAGLFAGLTNMRTYASATAGILALPVYITDDLSNVMNAAICILIALIVSFVLTFFFVKIDSPVTEEERLIKKEGLNDETITQGYDQAIKVLSPIKGQIIPLTEVPDSVFANEIMGRTIAIEPEDNTVFAPFDGEIVTVFPTEHALGIKDKNGVELLVHIGIDTVELDGKGFKLDVKVGDIVQQGQKIGTFDREVIRNAGYSPVTLVVVTNTDQFIDVIGLTNQKRVTNENVLLTIFK
ncbi:TPA: beta-glucoside-specific PTS transporter subunit IIABC [Enterococcus faecium]|mgnify:CR=1 FL=1|uniref:PTS system sucrose-specific EIIBCA component n=2 Tax=Enterococcus faecium TaxID=1352 RepID=A0A829F8J1_ENTFC|nr:beta-glucoside-specific PTS transporter subunit IIABC [Enterococcus faecium]ELB16132.1 PTS system, beta-glucoside-specific IIABC component [Enterococcus faecium EnGen0025]ELB41986.1 PTS system, beta-glucoside-specific IIABC component [Enterococcus faecium EnGen0044]EOM18713.1 PTS system, beta-glucoside-specific IIABC component [Enterococcus faecium EnGen0192]KWY12005.1 PTS mannose transporter subunit IIC [Enterococcus faecium]MBE9893627.1 PTS transporter subunit EIIC [Enterococcus faecium]